MPTLDNDISKQEKEISNIEFKSIISDLFKHDMVKQMDEYRQHADTTTLEHCLGVAYMTYKICKKLNWEYKETTRAALLHDFFLYDWHTYKYKPEKFTDLHGFKHPKIALKNAEKYFNLTDREKDGIVNHMWPLTVKIPKYKETFVITWADKYCAVAETAKHFNYKYKFSTIYRYGYTRLTLMLAAI